MSSFNPLTGLIGLSVLVSSAFASPTPVVHRRAGAITWRSCSSEFNTTNPGAVCGNLDVPLDYTGKESREMLQLDLIKIPATKGVSRGSILFNPGGPGYPGNEWLDGSAAVLLALVNFFFLFSCQFQSVFHLCEPRHLLSRAQPSHILSMYLAFKLTKNGDKVPLVDNMTSSASTLGAPERRCLSTALTRKTLRMFSGSSQSMKGSPIQKTRPTWPRADYGPHPFRSLRPVPKRTQRTAGSWVLPLSHETSSRSLTPWMRTGSFDTGVCPMALCWGLL